MERELEEAMARSLAVLDMVHTTKGEEIELKELLNDLKNEWALSLFSQNKAECFTGSKNLKDCNGWGWVGLKGGAPKPSLSPA